MATRKATRKAASKKRSATRNAEQEAEKRVAALLAAIAGAEERLQSYADRLRETADQVASGEINYAHGWNRVRKIANEIASAKQ